MANWERIQQLRDHLGLLSADQIRMDKVVWINRERETLAEARTPTCGTVGCIAGHAGVLFGDPSLVLKQDSQSERDSATMANCSFVGGAASVAIIAERALELSGEEGSFMFYGAWHPTAPELDEDDSWDEYAPTQHLRLIPASSVLAYLDKAIAERDVFVYLEKAEGR